MTLQIDIKGNYSSGSGKRVTPSYLQVDERRMLSREITNSRVNSHPNSPSEALAVLAMNSGGQSSRFDDSESFGLARQGSMNLPLPEDSGVPSTHPDMCIVRVRRNHLIEVRGFLCHCSCKLCPHFGLCFWLEHAMREAMNGSA